MFKIQAVRKNKLACHNKICIIGKYYNRFAVRIQDCRRSGNILENVEIIIRKVRGNKRCTIAS